MLYDSFYDTEEEKVPPAAVPHVLIVEDCSAIQTMTKQVLEFHKYEVSTANNGKEGFEMARQNYYDAILLDLAMPNSKDGIECLKQIRKLSDKRKANVPIIAFTGNADFYTRIELKNMGFDEYIEKPTNYIGIDVLLDEKIAEYHRLYKA